MIDELSTSERYILKKYTQEQLIIPELYTLQHNQRFWTLLAQVQQYMSNNQYDIQQFSIDSEEAKLMSEKMLFKLLFPEYCYREYDNMEQLEKIIQSSKLTFSQRVNQSKKLKQQMIEKLQQIVDEIK